MPGLREVSRQFVVEFIELYKSYPCLWNVKSKEYSDKNLKEEAYADLAMKLNEVIQNSTRNTVIKKIDSLRGRFRSECKKVVASQRIDYGQQDVYVPQLWYYKHLLFLKNEEMPEINICTMDAKERDGRERQETPMEQTPEVISIDNDIACSTENAFKGEITYCRVCLLYVRNHYLLSDKYDRNKTYLEIFYECTNIWAQSNNPLCMNCAMKLSSFYEFLCTARESDGKLKELNCRNISKQELSSDYGDELKEIESIEDPLNGHCSDDESRNTNLNEMKYLSPDIDDDSKNKLAEQVLLLQQTEDRLEFSKNSFIKEESICSSKSDDGDCETIQPEIIKDNSHRVPIITEAARKKANAKATSTTCNVCRKVFSTKSNLRLHMLIHTGRGKFLCSICPKMYHQRYELRKHMRVHSGERPFECKYCKERFTNSSILKAHLRRHTGERPYSCEICGKSFTQPSNKKNHMKMIHLEKKIQCPHCDKKFARQIDLTIHLQCSSGVKRFICEFCPSGYNQRHSLNRHIMTHHPQDQTNATDST